MPTHAQLERAKDWLRSARAIAVLTGAGISAESGVPTFRGASGLWRQFKPENLATPEAFARNSQLVWEWYDWRRELIAGVQPNEGHRALALLEQRVADFTLVTQNVDGLHQQAGSRSVLELHGNIWMLRCTRCEHSWEDRRVPLPLLPQCPRCGSLARPGVVWFGENLPADVWRQAEQNAQTCDVFLVVGTSAVVYPAAGLAALARSSGARVIEINIDRTPLSESVDCSLIGSSAQVLTLLIDAG